MKKEVFNKCRNGLNKLDKLIKEDDEINQAVSLIIVICTLFSIVGGLLLGSMA